MLIHPSLQISFSGDWTSVIGSSKEACAHCPLNTFMLVFIKAIYYQECSKR
jgi:hypothetical protein